MWMTLPTSRKILICILAAEACYKHSPLYNNFYNIKQFQIDKQIAPSSISPAKFISPTSTKHIAIPSEPVRGANGNITHSEACMRTSLIQHLFGMHSGYVQDVHREQSYCQLVLFEEHQNRWDLISFARDNIPGVKVIQVPFAAILLKCKNPNCKQSNIKWFTLQVFLIHNKFCLFFDIF